MSDLLIRHGAGSGPRGGEILLFFCPGCGFGHHFEINCPNGNGWTWNGSTEKPTFAPSLLTFGTVPDKRCHLFVRDGQIQFLGDCHHQLAGQTVDMVPL